MTLGATAVGVLLRLFSVFVATEVSLSAKDTRQKESAPPKSGEDLTLYGGGGLRRD